MSNDQESDETLPPSDDGEVRVVSRSEASATIRAGNAVSAKTAGAALREARQNPGVPSVEDPTLLDLTNPQDNDPTAVQPTLTNFDDKTLPHWSAMSDDDETKPTLSQVWLSDLGEASGLGDADGNAAIRQPVASSLVPDNDTKAEAVISEAANATDTGENPLGDDDQASGNRFAADRPFGFESPSDDEKPAGGSGETRLSLIKRVGTGAVFAVAAIGAFAAGPTWALVLAFAVLMFAAVEYFDGLRRVGFKPATILGLLAVAGAILGGYARGEQALLLVAALSIVFTFFWYLTGVVRQAPTANIAVTLLGVFWVGVLGSYSALLLRMPNREGMTILLGAIIVTAAYDTAAYVGGVMFGKHKLAPSISPGKSWEGLFAGTIAAVVVSAFVVSLMHPWSLVNAIVLGIVVSCVAPLGDLAESMIKRDLGLKDMGRILPGHGGVLDRFDAMLLVLPATYYLVTLLHV